MRKEITVTITAMMVLLAGQSYAAAFMKYGDIAGESRFATDHKRWINLDSVNVSPQGVPSHAPEWNSSGFRAGDAFKQNAPFTFDRQPAVKPSFKHWTIDDAEDPKPAGLLIPAVQKIR